MYFDLKNIIYFCKLYNNTVKLSYCKYYCPFFEDVKSCPRAYEEYAKSMKERFEKKFDGKGT